MSGFLSNALGSLMGQGGSGGQGVTSQGAGGMLGQLFQEAGGVQGIVSKFQQAGLGDKVQSWVGNGGNASLSPGELGQVFPPQQIEGWAEQHGVPTGMASELISHLLPHAVDSQTQGGQVPSAEDDPFADGQGGGQSAAPAGGQGFDFGGLVDRLVGGR